MCGSSALLMHACQFLTGTKLMRYGDVAPACVHSLNQALMPHTCVGVVQGCCTQAVRDCAASMCLVCLRLQWCIRRQPLWRLALQSALFLGSSGTNPASKISSCTAMPMHLSARFILDSDKVGFVAAASATRAECAQRGVVCSQEGLC